MGGSGSGKRSSRRTVEGSCRIELSTLQAQGYFLGFGRVGSLSWRSRIGWTATVDLRTHFGDMDNDWMLLSYRLGEEPVRQEIRFVSIPMRFGGWRWYMLCPITGVRCATLVFCYRHNRFVGLKAAGISYNSQNDRLVFRLKQKAEKAEGRYRALSKYTRRPTRERLWNDYQETQASYIEALRRFCQR